MTRPIFTTIFFVMLLSLLACGAGAKITVLNTDPVLDNLTATAANEGGSSALSGTINDPDPLDSFTLTVDWGDGSPVEIYTYPAGTTSFSETHTYLDDSPSYNDYFNDLGTPDDDQQIFIGSEIKEQIIQFGGDGDDTQLADTQGGTDRIEQYGQADNDDLCVIAGSGDDVVRQYGGEGNDSQLIQGGTGQDTNSAPKTISSLELLSCGIDYRRVSQASGACLFSQALSSRQSNDATVDGWQQQQ